MEWYGKKGKYTLQVMTLFFIRKTLYLGMSWHIVVIESLATKDETKSDEPKIKTDFYVTIMSKQCKQDAKAVGAITKEILKLHKQRNPDVKQFWLRSDQVSVLKED